MCAMYNKFLIARVADIGVVLLVFGSSFQGYLITNVSN